MREENNEMENSQKASVKWIDSVLMSTNDICFDGDDADGVGDGERND